MFGVAQALRNNSGVRLVGLEGAETCAWRDAAERSIKPQPQEAGAGAAAGMEGLRSFGRAPGTGHLPAEPKRFA